MANTTTTAKTPSNGTVTGSSDYDALNDQVKTLKSDLASLTEMLTDIGVRRKDETVEAARARAKRMRAEASDRYDEAVDYANDARDQAFDAVRRQPGTAMAIAVGVGFLAGVLSGRR